MMEWGPGVIYSLCLVTSAACAALLIRSYARSRQPLLLWSAISFSLLALNNLTVVLDMVLFREIDFSFFRQATSLSAVLVLLYGFIWEVDR